MNALKKNRFLFHAYSFIIFFALLCVAVFSVEDTFAQGYDTGGTLDDPDRRVLLNNSSDRKTTITQIVYIVDDGSPNGVRFIYQNDPSSDNPGGGGPATSFMTTNSILSSDEVRIHRIRVDTSTTATPQLADIFPVDRVPSSVSNFAPNLVGNVTPSQNATIVLTGTAFPVGAGAGGAQQYNVGIGGPPTNEYISDLTNVVSITDMRSYWDLAGGALGSAGDGFPSAGTPPQRYVDIMYDELFCCFDFIAISERWGNTPMGVAALDQNGNILRRNSPGSSLTGTAKSFRVDLTQYQWNTGIQNQIGDVNGGQPQWISVFQIRQFYGGGLDDTEGTAGQSGPGGTGSIVDLASEPPIPVFGYRIYMLTSDGGDGKILSFQSPRITFTDDECWRTLSSPFEGLTYATVLNDIWTQGSLNSNYPDGDPNVYFFNINTNDYEAVADLNTVIAPGQGFLVSVFQDDEFGVPGSFDKALDRIRGKEHGDDAPATVTPALNTTANGWTLLGNPYATPIDFDLVTKTNLTNVAYVYDNANSNWVSSSSISGIGDFNGRISPFQGFFVQTASSGTPSVTFNDDAKVPKQSATFFGKENEKAEANFIRLQIKGEDLITSAWIVLDEFGDANGYTYGDALQLTPFAGDHAILATRKTDDTLLDIGVFPVISENEEIPVYIETTKPGRFTITATHLNLPLSMENLVLYDRDNNIEIPIQQNMEYEFEIRNVKKTGFIDNSSLSCNLAGEPLAMAGTPEKAKVSQGGTERFSIRLASDIGNSNELPVYVRLKQNYPNPFNPATQIQFELPVQQVVNLSVYDLTGRQVATLVQNESFQAGVHTVSFDAGNLSSGVYVYRLQAGSVVLTRKLTLIK